MATILATAAVSSDALKRLAKSFESFAEVDPALSQWGGLGNGYCVATDGEFAVLVDPQGYDYARYRTPRISLKLLLAPIPGPWEDSAKPGRTLPFDALLARKTGFPEDFAVTGENVAEVLARGVYAYQYRFPGLPALPTA